MRQNLKNISKFATSLPRGVMLDTRDKLYFLPSENLENSLRIRSNGKMDTVYTPDSSMFGPHTQVCRRIYVFGCELNFILIATGIPEPSDENVRRLTLCVPSGSEHNTVKK